MATNHTVGREPHGEVVDSNPGLLHAIMSDAYKAPNNIYIYIMFTHFTL